MEQYIERLEADVEWHKNLVRRLTSLLEDARDHFEAVELNLRPLLPVVESAKTIYDTVVTDVRKVINDKARERS
jgi:hypothetical protein